MATSELVRLYLISQGQVLTVKAVSLKNQNILKNLYFLNVFQLLLVVLYAKASSVSLENHMERFFMSSYNALPPIPR